MYKLRIRDGREAGAREGKEVPSLWTLHPLFRSVFDLWSLKRTWVRDGAVLSLTLCYSLC
jgi:hypothetical protein